MKRFLILIAATFMLGTIANAQPAKRRTVSSNAIAQQSSAQKTPTDRASLMFPTSETMPEDVVWKRDVYRQLDLMKDKNAPMYYPVEPVGKQVNLFTYLFRLILTGRVTAYTYKLDGNESFEEKDKMPVKDMLERYGIYYEENDEKITVADSDVPSAEATRYYIKESIYFDQRQGTFSTKVTALCPILMRGADEFSTDATPYPLFWVKYSDIAPWLAKLPMMGSNLNNVTNLTADDYFTLNRYEGKIYKTNNLQGRVLANYCKTDSAMVQEQEKIEKQLHDFQEMVYGHKPALADTTATDSLNAADVASAQPAKQKKGLFGSSRRRTSTPTSNASAPAPASKESKPAAVKEEKAAAPRVSSRRQRR